MGRGIGKGNGFGNRAEEKGGRRARIGSVGSWHLDCAIAESRGSLIEDEDLVELHAETRTRCQHVHDGREVEQAILEVVEEEQDHTGHKRAEQH